MPDQIWLDSWGLKLFGYVRLMREVIPHMIRQGGSRVELGMSAAEYEATCVKEIPMARLGRPEEMADLIITADGGMTKAMA